jgi:MoxR-like ATPase
VLTVALDTGRHVVIEGPPGTGKSTLLRDIARHAGKAVVFAEGNAELTPGRLIGQYDPASPRGDRGATARHGARRHGFRPGRRHEPI